MKQTSRFLAALLWLTVKSIYSPTAYAESQSLIVSSGEYDRAETLVTCNLPHNLRGSWVLSDLKGNSIPIQIDERGVATFVLRRLPRGETRTYQLVSQSQPNDAHAVTAQKEGTKVNVRVNGRPFFSYQAEKSDLPRTDIPEVYRRGAYIHPLLTPSGKLLTDDYPADHAHHHGIWFAWSNAKFEGHPVNFWETAAKLGTVEFASLSMLWSGPVHGGFQAEHRFLDLTASKPKTVLNETWRVTAYNFQDGSAPRWVFDLVSTQTCASSSPLTLPQNLYGGMSIRGNGLWHESNPVFFLTSEGRDRTNGNETRGRWCHMGGNVDGQLGGVVVLCHPDNFYAPQPMRIHSGKPYFCYSPQQMGDFEIKPGRPYISRYRYVVFDGPPDRRELERLWQDYAHPPEVSLTSRK